MRVPFTTYPQLPEIVKEMISLGKYNFYRMSSGRLILEVPQMTQEPEVAAKWYEVAESGEVELLPAEPEDLAVELIDFELPERLTNKYLQINFPK